MPSTNIRRRYTTVSATLLTAVLATLGVMTPAAAAQPNPRPETVGGISHTWTNYKNAGGTAGQPIPSHKTVEVSCRIRGFKVTDGNVWWYRLASAPWNGRYYVSADAFYNDGETSGSLLHTPFFDPKVPLC